jgi:uncharacterized protein (DUF1800 family)
MLRLSRRGHCGAIVIALIAAVGALRSHAADPFGQRLSSDRQVAHVLNRLAYGARPGDLDDVKRRGVETWIRAQLTPERIPQSRGLEARLKPLGSVMLTTREVFEKYSPAAMGLAPAPPTPLAQLLPASQVAMLQKGTLDDRKAIFAALTGDTRRQVLIVVPPESMRDLSEIQVEAFNLRQAENERRTAEQRRLRPPLTELLSQEQVTTLMRGTDEEKTALLNGLDPEKRKQVLRQVPPVVMPLEVRREAITLGQPAQLPLVELIDAKVYRAVYSTRQLEEVLVDFWLNHFNVFSGKGPVRTMLPSYEREAIRPHVLGKFRDMVLATARHPAMLFYLDNWQSQAPRPDAAPSPAVQGAPRQGLNENYGRELMELHTLGVDGGYTQADVVNVARVFTGWTINEPNRLAEFLFNPSMHDGDEKVVLGRRLPPGGGEEEGRAVIDLLSRHPSTARFVARKLAQRFVADAPPQRLVDRVAARFMKTDGDLRAVMETLLLSDEFMSEGAWQSKLKSPLELAASALRALNADVSDTMILATRIGELGQPLYGKAEPTGYPNTGEMWASSASILGRINFAEALTSGQIPGVKVDATVMQSASPQIAAARLLGVPPSAGVVKALESLPGASSEARAAVLLASPDFQKR